MSIKLNRAIKTANVFKGSSTVSAIMEQVPEQLIKNLSSKDLAIVIESVNKAYHNGRTSTGAEMIDTNCVWVNGINKMIEWNEEGAEYQKVTEPCEPWGTVTKSVKVKEGVLVPRFC